MHYADLSGFYPEHGSSGGNLEFRFSGPGSIPNAVHQYNVLRGAELAELRRRRERPSSLPVFCKVRCPDGDVTSMVTSRDQDVVTQLSLDSKTTFDDLDYDNDDDEYGMGDSLRLCGGADSHFSKGKGKGNGKGNGKGKGKGKGKTMVGKVNGQAKSSKKQHKQQQSPDPYQNDDFLNRLENLHHEVCAELKTLVDEGEVMEPSPKIKKVAKPKRRQRTKQRHEGGTEKKENQTLSVSYEDYYLPQPKWVGIMPAAVMSQGIKVNVCTCPSATQQSAYKFMEQYGGMDPESLTPFFDEDSDLDHEFADRKGYLRYVEPRPHLDDDFSDESPVNTCQASADTSSTGKPYFIEVERRPHRVSLLRSMSPMRYTSQCSGLAHKAAAPVPNPSQMMLKVPPPLDLQEAKKKKIKKPKVPLPTTAKTKQGFKGNAAPAAAKDTRSRPVRSARVVEPQVRLPAGTQPQRMVSTIPDKAPPAPPATPQPILPKRQQKRRKPSPTVVYSKSLEDLKSEKLRIYNKISFTHERIISALDKLQISLLQLPPMRPCKAQEQQKRQRNAFEFCVRFARNFLYPLKGMIDDVRVTSVAIFNSAISNEACHRVMCVYGLMLQSIQTYQRHLRYFLLEKVAQKLSALIEMIYTMTNCCLEKNILARRDPVVESLLERCTRFLSFIEDMQEERSKLASETNRQKYSHSMAKSLVKVPPRVQRRIKLASPPQAQLRAPRPAPGPALALAQPRQPRHPKQEKLRSHKRYDLKMFLNDLKVYEPRVVPKEQPKMFEKIHRRRRRSRHVNGIPTTLAERPSDSELESVREEIQTQMQIQANDSTDSLSLPPAESHGNRTSKEGSPMREAMLEAMRRAARSQFQQVLDPMMRSLSAMLNEKIERMAVSSKNK